MLQENPGKVCKTPAHWLCLSSEKKTNKQNQTNTKQNKAAATTTTRKRRLWSMLTTSLDGSALGNVTFFLMVFLFAVQLMGQSSRQSIGIGIPGWLVTNCKAWLALLVAWWCVWLTPDSCTLQGLGVTGKTELLLCEGTVESSSSHLGTSGNNSRSDTHGHPTGILFQKFRNVLWCVQASASPTHDKALLTVLLNKPFN